MPRLYNRKSREEVYADNRGKAGPRRTTPRGGRKDTTHDSRLADTGHMMEKGIKMPRVYNRKSREEVYADNPRNAGLRRTTPPGGRKDPTHDSRLADTSHMMEKDTTMPRVYSGKSREGVYANNSRKTGPQRTKPRGAPNDPTHDSRPADAAPEDVPRTTNTPIQAAAHGSNAWRNRRGFRRAFFARGKIGEVSPLRLFDRRACGYWPGGCSAADEHPHPSRRLRIQRVADPPRI
ncbi:MAG: hypothetical protein FRX48_06305 [Lasallia pustulata]|uniref:Uncharacterized protein n=1 Tax=Lasallia pustulata TaxID=136370 RepID=A0A5M8PJT4_9LECA|nr:MAG: hypothetical protein FRX48_06305 [Lasallia pustulata]